MSTSPERRTATTTRSGSSPVGDQRGAAEGPDVPGTPDIDFGSRTYSFDGGISGRFAVRSAVTIACLLAAAVAITVVTMTVGDFPLSVGQVVDALLGRGEDFQRTVVVDWRLPIALSAIVFGALLGLGGAIFQSLTRNPLGSPDIIGFDAGAYTAVIVTMLVVGTRDYWVVAAASLLGGALAAVIVYALAFRGGIKGFRLIITGIGVSAMLGSINSYLMSRARLDDAMAVGFWSAGSLARVTWTNLVPAIIALVVIAGVCAVCAPAMRQLELGDDAAVGHGVRVDRSRLALMGAGVATGAIVTAAAGPIGFIALAAPQVARRVTGTAGVGLVASAAMGAFLLACAHGIATLSAVWFKPIPAGLVTVSFGGLYFIILLVRETRRHV